MCEDVCSLLLSACWFMFFVKLVAGLRCYQWELMLSDVIRKEGEFVSASIRGRGQAQPKVLKEGPGVRDC